MLAIEQGSFFAEDSKRGYTVVKRNLIFPGDVEIGVVLADVDVDEDEIGLQDGQVFRVVEVDVEDLAVAAPFAAEVEQDTLVGGRGGLESGGDVGFGVRGVGIDFAAGRVGGCGSQGQQHGKDGEFDSLQGEPPGLSSSLKYRWRGVSICYIVSEGFGVYSGERMSSHGDLRKKLESTNYSDLGEMMEGYARAAAELAKKEFRQNLDFTSESIDALDEILVLVGESPELDVDFEVRLWGAYLGEVLRRRYAGGWEMTQYPGGAVAVPAVDVRGSRLFPLMKVYRRLTVGEEEDLRAFYAMVTERLGKPAQVN